MRSDLVSEKLERAFVSHNSLKRQESDFKPCAAKARTCREGTVMSSCGDGDLSLQCPS